MEAPLLHRDDPARAPLQGNAKVTRDDWLAQAKAVLIAQGISHVKIMPLAQAMGVSRSSFYWYFRNLAELHSALIEAWQRKNTGALIAQAEAPAASITAAVCNVQLCVVDTELYETALDFAMRDWARASKDVAALVKGSDAKRVAALTEMFARYGYPAREAEIRACTLYYQQIGYDLADLGHSPQYRLDRVADYLFVFTGQTPDPAEIDAFTRLASQHWRKHGTP
ncbi:MAG: TetR/AcrR family transcriptional regulator [Pseudomonadota bacterium]